MQLFTEGSIFVFFFAAISRNSRDDLDVSESPWNAYPSPADTRKILLQDLVVNSGRFCVESARRLGERSAQFGTTLHGTCPNRRLTWPKISETVFLNNFGSKALKTTMHLLWLARHRPANGGNEAHAVFLRYFKPLAPASAKFAGEEHARTTNGPTRA